LQSATGASVLVSGGFHTPEISKMLRAKNISHIVLAPKITRIDEAWGSAYLSVFAREKTPLEQLFEGETLFLAKEITIRVLQAQSVFPHR
jgi:hypothetical protein